jgi:hypothetical protein
MGGLPSLQVFSLDIEYGFKVGKSRLEERFLIDCALYIAMSIASKRIEGR